MVSTNFPRVASKFRRLGSSVGTVFTGLRAGVLKTAREAKGRVGAEQFNVKSDEGLPPNVNSLEILGCKGAKLILEVAKHRGDNGVRTFAVSDGDEAVQEFTGDPSIYVVNETFDRLANFIRELFDKHGPAEKKNFAPIHADSLVFTDLGTEQQILVKGSKIGDLLASYSNDKKKYCDAREFLKDAEFYFSHSPPDLIQSSSLLWQSAMYAVLDFYLQLGLKITSRERLHFFVLLAARECSCKMAVDLVEGWRYAEDFRLFTYCENFSPRKFRERMSAVRYFVEQFAKIPKAPVLSKVEKMAEEEKNRTGIKEESGKAVLGNKTYSYNVTFK